MIRSIGGVAKYSVHSCVPNHNPLSEIDKKHLSDFFKTTEKLFVLTGAGVSTESGIKDYRSEKVGLFASSDQRPTNYGDYLSKPEVRRRYWARNTTAWPFFKSFQPNVTHSYLATLEHNNRLNWLVTQNVDSLHYKAGSRRLTELHGTVSTVICLGCKVMVSRDEVQEQIFQLNPGWSATPGSFAPDADVFVAEEAVKRFKAPHCLRCGGVLKPDVVFFGDTIPRQKVAWVSNQLAESDAMAIMGSSIETYSALRHVKQAKELGLPILMVNIGPSRATPLADIVINARTGEVSSWLLDNKIF